MSVSYSINIEIDAELNLTTIEKLLQKGHLSNIIYFNGDNIGTPVISPSKAAQKIFILTPEDEESPCIFSRCEDTYFYLWISKKDDGIEILMGAFMYPWYKEFYMSDDTHFDFDRYINVLLKLCSDFTIRSLTTETIY